MPILRLALHGAVALAVAAPPVLLSTLAAADSPYPIPTRDGRETIRREGVCPTGYVGLGDKCVALHKDTPRAYHKIEGAACPSGTFASGAYCKAFR